MIILTLKDPEYYHDTFNSIKHTIQIFQNMHFTLLDTLNFYSEKFIEIHVVILINYLISF